MAGYINRGLTREDIDSSRGALVLEFGTDWCGFCHSAAPAVEEAFSEFPSLRHVKVEDGPGRHLGRSFRVKLWPTLIILKDGGESRGSSVPGTLRRFGQSWPRRMTTKLGNRCGQSFSRFLRRQLLSRKPVRQQEWKALDSERSCEGKC
jgi:thioredoxin 1